MKIFSALSAFFWGVILFAFLNNTIAQFLQRVSEMDSIDAFSCIACCGALGLYSAYMWTKR